MGVTGNAQDAANEVLDLAKELANDAVDLGEHNAKVVLETGIKIYDALGEVLKAASGKLVG